MFPPMGVLKRLFIQLAAQAAANVLRGPQGHVSSAQWGRPTVFAISVNKGIASFSVPIR